MMSIVLAIAAMMAAVLGGVFLTFSDFVMRALRQSSGVAGMEAMQNINRTVYRSIFMGLLMGFAGTSVVLIIWGIQAGSATVIWAGGAYLLGTMGTTMFGNVPMNKRLDQGGGGLAYWDVYVARWTRLNHVRSIACILTAVGFLNGALVFGG
ncbi:MAG: anthrone oxygenase family protein [Paracoccaceae bacterium]